MGLHLSSLCCFSRHSSFCCWSLSNSSSLVCPLNPDYPSVSGLFMYLSSFEPSAVSSVSCWDSDIHTVLLNRVCHLHSLQGFPSRWTSATWKLWVSTLTRVRIHVLSCRHSPTRVCLNPLVIHPWALCDSPAVLHLFHGWKGWPGIFFITSVSNVRWRPQSHVKSYLFYATMYPKVWHPWWGCSSGLSQGGD